MNLPEMSVRNPVTALMMFLGVILVGAFCMIQMPIDLFPEMDIPVITVITPYDGAGPEEVEEKVTQPLEEKLATVDGLKHILSTSREGMSVIRLMFDWETNIDSRANDVRDAIDQAKNFVAEEADDSRVYKLDVSQFPIMVYGVRAGQSYGNLQDILKDYIADPLESVPGVGSVQVITPLRRQVNVDLDRERLASYGLTPDDVVRVIAQENRQASAGSIKQGDIDYLPRVPGEFRSVEPMNDIVVRASQGVIVRLRDVGRVSDAFKEVTLSVRINGEPGAVLLVQKQSQANTVKVARSVRTALKQLTKRLPPDVRLVPVMDSSEDIARMVRDLIVTLVTGGGLAILVVLIFLRRARATLIISLTIPFSLVASGVPMYLMGYTINMITLFALIISIGMVVDNAIVVLENITRHREEGESAREGAIFGTAEVAMAITSSTLTTVCIFFPLLFVKGLSKILFFPFAIVATVVLGASLFTALTMTPMMASRLLGGDGNGREGSNAFFRTTEAAFDRLADGYSRMLGWSLRHRWTVIMIVLGLAGCTLTLLPIIGWEFSPKEDQSFIQGQIEMPVGTRVERTAEAMQAIYRMIREEIPQDAIRAMYTRCGTSSDAWRFDEGAHVGIFGVKLVNKEHRKQTAMELGDRIRRRLKSMAGLYGITKCRVDLQDPMSSMIRGGEQPLSVNVLGNDLEAADAYARELKAKIQQIPGTVDIATSMNKGAPEVWVDVDRRKASALGLNVSDVADTVRTSVYGRVASIYRSRGDEYDIFVRLREQDRATPDSLREIPLRLPSGELVRLEGVADVRVERGPIVIERKDQQRIVRVEGDVHGRSLGEVAAEIKKLIADSEPPRGVTVVMGGQSEDIGEAFLWLGIALVIGIALIYMIMASQFESLRDPFVVMFSVPVAILGVIWFLALGGYSLNIFVFLGVLLLVGVVVNNAIVLVDYINILRARGRSMTEAVQEAGRTRLRPVLMTAITTIVALMPMAFKQGQGSEVYNCLGVTILGGLSVSTLVTLILVPTIYSLFEGRRRAER